MSIHILRPTQLQINAWTGDTAITGELPVKTPWAQVVQGQPMSKWLGPAVPVDLRDWRHPDVGWGLVLPDDDALSTEARARGDDAPEAIRRLLQARPGSPVLRWRPDLQQNYLRRYYLDGKPPQDLSIAAPKPGIKAGYIPRYLLIYASPQKIPWAVQYALNMSTFVGRLDLAGPSLDNYIDALIGDWAGATCHPRAPLVWRVDHGQNDITWLMARAVAGNLWTKFEADPDLSGRFLLKDQFATGNDICSALVERSPGLVVTTSHGMTGPLTDKAALIAQLGLPVDVNHQPLDLQALSAWKPSGAIWYAHACCSAGSDSTSRYAKLLAPDSMISYTLNGVANTAGAMVAPLPRTLLGAQEPLRAFVGHVEPTFDWTLRDPATQQVLTHVLCSALYNNLYQQDKRTPIGFALANVFAEAGAFYGAWQDAIAGINNNEPGMRDWALYRQLVAMDRQTLVIIGDPTVSLPLLGTT